jgi:hypothetical protein
VARLGGPEEMTQQLVGCGQQIRPSIAHRRPDTNEPAKRTKSARF